MKINLLTLLLVLIGTSSFAQVITNLPCLDGNIETMLVQGDTVYISGRFNRLYDADSSNRYGGMVDKQTGVLINPHFNPNGPVTCALADSNGGYFIAGLFTAIGDSIRGGLAHIDSTGHVTNLVAGITISGNSDVSSNTGSLPKALLLRNDTLYIGGNFTQVNGSSRVGMALISISTGQLLPVSLNLSTPYPGTSMVNALKDDGNMLYVGGAFTSIGGQARNSFAVVDLSTMNITSWNIPMMSSGAEINAITYTDSLIYLGGKFDYVLDYNCHNLRGFYKTTALPHSFIPPFNSSTSIYGLTLFGDTLIAAGDVLNVFFFSLSTGATLSTNKVFTSGYAASDVAVDGPWLYIASGTYGESNITVGNTGFARYNFTTSTTDLSWDPGSTYAGGAFKVVPAKNSLFLCNGLIGGKHRKYIAAFLASTGKVLDWAPHPDWYFTAMTRIGNTLYAVGGFSTVDTCSRKGFVALDATTGTVNTTTFDITGTIYALAQKDSLLFIGTSIGISTFNTGSLTPLNIPFGISTNVYSLQVLGNRLFAGGDFSITSGTDVIKNACAFNIPTGALTSWRPKVGIVSKLVCLRDKVFLPSGNPSFLDTLLGNALYSPIVQNATSAYEYNGLIYATGSYFNTSTRPAAASQYLGIINANTLDLVPVNWKNFPSRMLMNNFTVAAVSGNKLLLGARGYAIDTVYPLGFQIGLIAMGLDTLFTLDTIPVKKYCAGNTIPVSFSCGIPFHNDNTFTVELSDSSGSFNNPTIIGTFQQSYPDRLLYKIPETLPFGTKYRIRAKGTSPAKITADNGYDLTINGHQSIGFSLSIPSPCTSNMTIYFTDTSSTSSPDSVTRKWTFSTTTAATNTSNLSIASQTYTVAGNYLAKLVSYTSNGCVDSVTKTIPVDLAPKATFQPTGTKSICKNRSVYLYTNKKEGYSYTWMKDNSILLSDSNSCLAYEKGSYRLILTNTNQCRDTSPATIIVMDSLKVRLKVTNLAPPCLGTNSFLFTDSSIYSNKYHFWEYGDGTSTYDKLPGRKTYDTPGTYRVTLTAFDLGGNCSDTLSQLVTVFAEPHAVITVNRNGICDGDSVQLKAELGYTYEWKKDQVTLPQTQSDYYATTAGEYVLILSHDHQCQDTSDPVLIHVNSVPSKPIITLSGKSLTTDPGTHAYNWYKDQTLIEGAHNIYYTPSESGNYVVEVVNDSGCSNQSDPYNFTYVGIAENLQEDAFIKLFPNPASNDISIDITLPVQTYDIHMYHSSGKLVYQSLGNNKKHIEISLPSDIKEGLYLVEIKLDHNKVARKKLMIISR